ncbi:MAG TPA: hypothetical protein VMV58_04920 [Desulfosporosinus sp.]|nr:hypothetical protein [Desulfosporosinus sp.]
MNLEQCQIISDKLTAIDALNSRINKRIRDTSGIIQANLMPYNAKVRAQDLLKEVQTMLTEVEEQKKPIYELLKQEREEQK